MCSTEEDLIDTDNVIQTCTLRTLTDIILVSFVDAPEKTKGGLWIPDCSLMRSYEEHGLYLGRIEVCGPDCRELKVGDIVIFSRSTYVLFEHEGVRYRGLHEHDCLGVLETDATLTELQDKVY